MLKVEQTWYLTAKRTDPRIIGRWKIDKTWSVFPTDMQIKAALDVLPKDVWCKFILVSKVKLEATEEVVIPEGMWQPKERVDGTE